MRYIMVLSYFLFVGETPAAAQRLDIGGIELYLGQGAGDALRSLSAYTARYYDENQSWYVTQKVGTEYRLLGHFAATDGKISFIAKRYHLASEHDGARAYTQALRDAKKRGGASCQMRAVEGTDDLVHQIETVCGSYRLSYFFPLQTDQGSAGAAVFVQVRAR